MNKKFALYALPVLAAAIIVGVGFASAHEADGEGFMPGWFKFKGEEKPNQEEMMAKKAEMLGVTVEELEDAKEEGTWHEFIEGIDLEGLWAQKMEQKQTRIQERLDQLITNGKITTEEAEAKLTAMQEKFENKEFGHGHKFFKRGWFHKGKPHAD